MAGAYRGGVMSDGAHLGVSAQRALDTIIGAAPSPEATGEHLMSPPEMRAWLLAADPARAHSSYDEAARYAGRLVLEWFLADPAHAGAGEREIYDAMKAAGAPLEELKLTGFMWGWALNAARRSVELGPVPNPAIIEVEVEQ